MQLPDFSILQVLAVLVASTVAIATVKLVTPILKPTIIVFPWTKAEKTNEKVILAGSYNPPHLGHLAMLEYLSKR